MVLDEFVERYYGAYNDKDLEGILAHYAPDAEYRVHGVDGVQTFRGVDALRGIYRSHLEDWPDQRLDVLTADGEGDLLVCHVAITGTLVVPWEMAGRTYRPTGEPITFEIAHAIRFQDGRIKVKDGWIDGLALHNRLSAATAAA